MAQFRKLFKKTINKSITQETLPNNYVEINNDPSTELQIEPEEPKNYVELDYGLNKSKSKWENLKPIEISKIKKINFPSEQYYRIETPKNQITIHHTVSGIGVKGDINTWLSDNKRIATHIIIGHDGTPYQCFSSKYWGHHLGVKSTFLKNKGFKDYKNRNVLLNENSISIEIDSWGGLILGDGETKKFGNKNVKTKKDKFYNAYGRIVKCDIIEFEEEFRGYKYYEKYTDEQIQTLGELILYFKDRYNIPVDYNEDIWDININALSGESGVYAHVSYREDKSDASPQPELINMLKTLKLL